jgi:uncharacterized protein (DUF934 family)
MIMLEPKREIILDKTVQDDAWQVLRLEQGEENAENAEAAETAENVIVAAGHIIVPLTVWQAQRSSLQARAAQGEIGVWIGSDERPEVLKDDLPQLPLIAIDFPKFSDGRGYSIAYNLRARLAFTGQLRAIGDVLRDQMFYMQRVGFNAFAPRADRNIHDALKGLTDFSETYQHSLDQKTPLFRRVQRQSVAPQERGLPFGDGLGI